MDDALQNRNRTNEFLWPVGDGADLLTRRDAAERKRRSRRVDTEVDLGSVHAIISHLIDLLNHGGAADRLTAADSFVAIGLRVLPALQAQLDTAADPAVQAAVAELLAEIGAAAFDRRQTRPAAAPDAGSGKTRTKKAKAASKAALVQLRPAPQSQPT